MAACHGGVEKSIWRIKPVAMAARGKSSLCRTKARLFDAKTCHCIPGKHAKDEQSNINEAQRSRDRAR